MPKRSSKPDINQIAAHIVERSTAPNDELPNKNPAAVALGRLGGQKGGPARAKALSPARRKAIARQAARQRWRKSE